MEMLMYIVTIGCLAWMVVGAVVIIIKTKRSNRR